MLVILVILQAAKLRLVTEQFTIYHFSGIWVNARLSGSHIMMEHCNFGTSHGCLSSSELSCELEDRVQNLDV